MHSSIPVGNSIRVVGLVCLTATLVGSLAVLANERRAKPAFPDDHVRGTLVDSADRVARGDCPCISQATSTPSAAGVTCVEANHSTKLISPGSSEDEIQRIELKPGESFCTECLPMPASPSPQHRPEEKHWHHELYAPVPILGPTTEGGPPVAIDPPSDDEIMRALERAQPVRGGVPFVREKQRNNVHIVKEKIVEYVDPPRFYSLIGPAQLHHAHYKCTIHRSADDKEVIKVIYVDHNHFHTIGDVEPDTPPSLEPIASTDADS